MKKSFKKYMALITIATTIYFNSSLYAPFEERFESPATDTLSSQHEQQKQEIAKQQASERTALEENINNHIKASKTPLQKRSARLLTNAKEIKTLSGVDINQADVTGKDAQRALEKQHNQQTREILTHQDQEHQEALASSTKELETSFGPPEGEQRPAKQEALGALVPYEQPITKIPMGNTPAEATKMIEANPDKYALVVKDFFTQADADQAERNSRQDQALTDMHNMFDQAEQTLETSKNSLGAKAKKLMNDFVDQYFRLFSRAKRFIATDNASLAVIQMANRPVLNDAYKALDLSNDAPRAQVDKAYEQLRAQALSKGNRADAKSLTNAYHSITEPHNLDMKAQLNEELEKMRQNLFNAPDPYNNVNELKELANTYLKTLQSRETTLTPETAAQLRDITNILNKHLPPDKELLLDLSRDADAGGNYQGKLENVSFTIASKGNRLTPIKDAESALNVDLTNPDLTPRDINNIFERKKQSIEKSSMSEADKQAAIQKLEGSRDVLLNARQKGLTRDTGGWQDTLHNQRANIASAEKTLNISVDESRNTQDIENALTRNSRRVRAEFKARKISAEELTEQLNKLKEARDTLVRAKKGRTQTSLKEKVAQRLGIDLGAWDRRITRIKNAVKDLANTISTKFDGSPQQKQIYQKALNDLVFKAQVEKSSNVLGVSKDVTAAELERTYLIKRRSIEKNTRDRDEENAALKELDDAYTAIKGSLKTQERAKRTTPDNDPLETLSTLFDQPNVSPEAKQEFEELKSFTAEKPSNTSNLSDQELLKQRNAGGQRAEQELEGKSNREILNLPKNATEEMISNKYRELIFKYRKGQGIKGVLSEETQGYNDFYANKVLDAYRALHDNFRSKPL